MKRAALPMIALVLAGCASTPHVRYWSLRTEVAASVPKNHHCTIQIAPISLPETYDRADVVTTTGSNQVTWESTEQWEGTLPDVLSGRLASSLRHDVEGSAVYTWPSILVEPPSYNVRIQLPQIRATLGGKVVIDALWSVSTEAGKTINGSATLEQATADASYQSLVQATGLTTDAVSAAIAVDIQKLGACATHQ